MRRKTASEERRKRLGARNFASFVHSLSHSSKLICYHRKSRRAGVDPGFFSRGGAPFRNGVTD